MISFETGVKLVTLKLHPRVCLFVCFFVVFKGRWFLKLCFSQIIAIKL